MQALLIAGLFVLGAACGAAVRLMVFVGVLIVGAVIAATAAAFVQGVGQAGWAALVTVVVLQIGYAAGFVLRAGVRSVRERMAARATHEKREAPRLGGERRP